MTIAHAAERTYTRGSVAFALFLGVPKIEIFMVPNPKASLGSRFFGGRVQKCKNDTPVYRWPEMQLFVAIEL